MVKSLTAFNHKQLTGKKIHVFLHIAVWIILFVLPAYLLYIDSGSNVSVLKMTYIQIFLYAVIFYANYLLLSPFLFLKQRKILYFFSALSLVAVASMVSKVTFRLNDNIGPDRRSKMEMRQRMQPPPGIPFMPKDALWMEPKRPSENWPMYNFIITTLFLSGFGMGLSFSDKLRQHEKQRKEAEKEKLNSELAFLKSQINPHFLFNTLNNIYSLVETNVQDGQKAILQLSKLMRYILYETENGDKLLSQEIEFMRTYIDLMKLRISEKVSVTVSFPENFTDTAIPPLLFLPFVENAFKHGISYRKPSFVTLLLKVDPGKIVFECSNSIVTRAEDDSKPDSGIGLENVKKRLLLLFPGHHHLNVFETHEIFHVILTIDTL